MAKHKLTLVTTRLRLNAGIQFGIAGLGIIIVCILRKESFMQFGLVKKNVANAIALTILYFILSIGTQYRIY